jgi:hypothetical protein
MSLSALLMLLFVILVLGGGLVFCFSKVADNSSDKSGY